MARILITGVNGFVGSYVAKFLSEKEHDVIGTGRGQSRVQISSSHFHYCELDFTNSAEVRDLINKHRPSVIIHAGAMTKPDECELNKTAAFTSNVEGTKNMLSAAVGFHRHFIYISTDFIFKGEKPLYKEDDIGEPVNYYGYTKLMAEEAVKQYPGDWSILRPVLVYGQPGPGKQNILTNVAQALKEEKVLNMYSDQVRTPTYVEDLANAIVSIVEKRASGIYHLSGEEQFTPFQLAVEVAEYLGLKKQLINAVTNETFKQPALRPPRTIFDLTKAKKDLGYRVTPFAEGLRKTFADSNL